MATAWPALVGDPNPLGWVTTAAYLAAALAAGLATRRNGPGAKDRPAHRRAFWLGVAALLIALGVNKQLDLQSLLTATMRNLAREGGWYDWRRQMQAMFVTAIAASFVAAALALALRVWRAGRWERLGAAGTVLLLGFVAVRAAAFHHAVGLIGGGVGERVAHLVELAAACLIGYAALGARRSLSADPAPRDR